MSASRSTAAGTNASKRSALLTFGMFSLLGACRPVEPSLSARGGEPGARTEAVPVRETIPSPPHRTISANQCALMGDTVACLRSVKDAQGTAQWRRLTLGNRETLRDAVHIAAALDRVCALNGSGEVVCWRLPMDPAWNLTAEIGAVSRVLARDVIDVEVGHEHLCLLDKFGDVSCQGSNEYGQLGHEGVSRVDEPLRVALGERAIDIVVGPVRTCALLESRTVSCWGGDDTPVNPRWRTPTRVEGVDRVARLLSPETARLEGGAVVRWSWPLHLPESFGPARVVLETAPSAAMTRELACALADGALRCARTHPAYMVTPTRYRPDNRDVAYTLAEPLVPVLDDVTEVVADGSLVCARQRDGLVSCWGAPNHGVIGDPFLAFDPSPQPVVGVDDAVEVVMRGQACVRRRSGAVTCWGGQHHRPKRSDLKPDERIDFSARPVTVALPGPASALGEDAVNGPFAWVDGTPHCWSPSHRFERSAAVPAECVLEDGVSGGWVLTGGKLRPSPGAKPPGGLKFREGALGGFGECRLTRAGEAHCWTRDPAGTSHRTHRVFPDTARIAVGGLHACVLGSDGRVQCWGYGLDGVVGHPVPDPNTTYEPEVVLEGAVDLAAWSLSTCAVMASGSVQCWGNNAEGVLGRGEVLYRRTMTPVALSSLSSPR